MSDFTITNADVPSVTAQVSASASPGGVASPNSLPSVVDWSNAWAVQLLSAANGFLNDNFSEVTTDYYGLVGDIPVLNSVTFDDMLSGLVYPSAQAQAQLNAQYTLTPESKLPLDKLLTELETFANGYPLLNPTDPGLVPIDPIAFDSFGVAPPTITIPTSPVPLAVSAPVASFTIETPVSPTPPSVDSLPSVPTFASLNIPAMPNFTLPTYSPVAPQNQLTPPTDKFSYVDPGYTSVLDPVLTAKLLNDLNNGGYGIEPNDEVMLWNRARDRETQLGLVRVAEVSRQAAAMSFPMPQGSLFAALAKANEDMQEKLASLSREVALKRADLYVANRRFTIEQVQQHERIMIELYTSGQERALNMAKASVDLGVQIFDAGVRNFNAKLAAYTAGAQVFETQVRAQLAAAEMYKAQISAQELIMGLDRAKVELYVAQLEGVKYKVDVYRAQVEGVLAQMQVEEMKLRTFEDNIKAYTSQVQAKEVEWNAYTAAIQGQGAQVNLYRGQLDAFVVAQDEKLKEKRFLIESNDQKIKQYGLEVENYKDRIDAVAKQLNASIESNRTDVASYDVRVRAYQMLEAVQQEYARQRLEARRLTYDQNVKGVLSQADTLKFALDKQDKQLQLIDKIDGRGIEYYRTLLGTVLSNVNSLATLSATQ